MRTVILVLATICAGCAPMAPPAPPALPASVILWKEDMEQLKRDLQEQQEDFKRLETMKQTLRREIEVFEASLSVGERERFEEFITSPNATQEMATRIFDLPPEAVKLLEKGVPLPDKIIQPLFVKVNKAIDLRNKRVEYDQLVDAYNKRRAELIARAASLSQQRREGMVRMEERLRNMLPQELNVNVYHHWGY